jgi:hypothetical protein
LEIASSSALGNYLGENVHVKRGAIESLGNSVNNANFTKFSTLTFDDGSVYKNVLVDSALGGRIEQEGAFLFRKTLGVWRLIGHDTGEPNGLRVSAKSGTAGEIFLMLVCIVLAAVFAAVMAFIALWAPFFWLFFAIPVALIIAALMNIWSLVSVSSAVDGLKAGAMRQARKATAANAA